MEIESYLASLPDRRKIRLEMILNTIVALYPNARASMKYKMPTYTHGEGWVAAANQKHYISVYTCGIEHLAAFKRRHPHIKTGKGCINFKDSDDIPLDDLRIVIKSAMETHHG